MLLQKGSVNGGRGKKGPVAHPGKKKKNRIKKAE